MAQHNEILAEPASPAMHIDLPLGAKLAAFLPITVAVAAEIPAIDSIATGSIATD
jgi:hypothetical protein